MLCAEKQPSGALHPRVTHTHTRWDLCCEDPAERHRRVAGDIHLCRETLLSKTGTGSRHLCWPKGGYTPEYIRLARALGVTFLYTTERWMNSRHAGTLCLERISTKEREHCGCLKRRLFYYTTPFFFISACPSQGGASDLTRKGSQYHEANFHRILPALWRTGTAGCVTDAGSAQ